MIKKASCSMFLCLSVCSLGIGAWAQNEVENPNAEVVQCYDSETGMAEILRELYATPVEYQEEDIQTCIELVEAKIETDQSDSDSVKLLNSQIYVDQEADNYDRATAWQIALDQGYDVELDDILIVYRDYELEGSIADGNHESTYFMCKTDEWAILSTANYQNKSAKFNPYFEWDEFAENGEWDTAADMSLLVLALDEYSYTYSEDDVQKGELLIQEKLGEDVFAGLEICHDYEQEAGLRTYYQLLQEKAGKKVNLEDIMVLFAEQSENDIMISRSAFVFERAESGAWEIIAEDAPVYRDKLGNDTIEKLKALTEQ